MKNYIKDSSGRILGWTQDNGSIESAYDKSGKYLGKYDSRVNKTYGISGGLLSTGNTLSALIVTSTLDF
jgi:hypothetical protein